jgi:hypothetical protein
VTGSTSYIASQNYLTDAGAYALSTSPYGTYDQGGNVWEWNEALISGEGRGLRGGEWDFASFGLLASYRLSVSPSFESVRFGFRVATVPEPSTFALAALGIVSMLAFARQRTRRAGALSAKQGLATSGSLR